jgi:hypothetical protein
MAVENRVSDAEQARRIRARYENSGSGAKPNQTVKVGDGERRTFHNTHHSGHFVQPDTAAKPTSGKVDSTSESRGGKAPAGWDLKR